MASRFWALARTPRWIAALLLALGVAAAFAVLGQWQLERSIENAAVVEIDTETPVALDELAEPGSGLTDAQLGRIVTFSGDLIADDMIGLENRPDGLGGTGTWLVGHVVTDAGVSVAVVLGSYDGGYVPLGPLDDHHQDWSGRYLPSEEPQSSDFENGERTALSVAELVNLWQDGGPVYAGFVVLSEPQPGLGPIEATAPEREVVLNILNLFYAIEWVLFAGFAIYLWYRLVRDAVEREQEAPDPTTAQP